MSAPVLGRGALGGIVAGSSLGGAVAPSAGRDVPAEARRRASAGRTFDPDPEIAVRGTVLVLPGRGEHGGVYQRFGRRLAADGYAVRVLDDPAAIGLTGAVLTDMYQDAPRPLIVAGSDTGALRALAIADAHVLPVDGVLLAGLVTEGTPFAEAGTAPDSPGVVAHLRAVALDFDAELDARTACPAHRGRLGRDTSLRRGELAAPVPVELTDAVCRLDPAGIGVPVLVVHGGADAIAPVPGAAALARALPDAELVTVVDGRHDILNDLHHRSVAAQIVQWLERLRAGAPILAGAPAAPPSSGRAA